MPYVVKIASEEAGVLIMRIISKNIFIHYDRTSSGDKLLILMQLFYL